jgi:hypothetical protein
MAMLQCDVVAYNTPALLWKCCSVMLLWQCCSTVLRHCFGNVVARRYDTVQVVLQLATRGSAVVTCDVAALQLASQRRNNAARLWRYSSHRNSPVILL